MSRQKREKNKGAVQAISMPQSIPDNKIQCKKNIPFRFPEKIANYCHFISGICAAIDTRIFFENFASAGMVDVKIDCFMAIARCAMRGSSVCLVEVRPC